MARCNIVRPIEQGRESVILKFFGAHSVPVGGGV
jgi:hypothetical protein